MLHQHARILKSMTNTVTITHHQTKPEYQWEIVVPEGPDDHASRGPSRLRHGRPRPGL